MILDINVGAIIYARTPDRIRARAGGAFRFINYGVRPIGALLGGLLGAAIGVREAIFVVDDRGDRCGVLCLVGSPVLRLRDLPEASAGLGAGVALDRYSQRKVAQRPSDRPPPTPQTARMTSDRADVASPDPSATRNASARAAAGSRPASVARGRAGRRPGRRSRRAAGTR